MPNYTVLNSKEINELNPGGGRRKGYRVWIRTQNGAEGTVDVGPDKWNPKDLAPILEARAAELDLPFTLT